MIDRKYIIGDAPFTARAIDPALYLVATPIGNLADVTIRALETLAAADVLACEDTRTTRVLLARYGIRRPTTAYHEHNADQSGPRLLKHLAEGRSVALVSDAGTPLISDPGYRLVTEAVEAGFRVIPIPGPSAVLSALTASGLATDSFLFAGFLPAKDGQRRTRLEALKTVAATLVFYESPQRLAASLRAMAEVLGADRRAAMCREITKTFEEVRRASLDALAAHYETEGPPRGEVVVCVEAAGKAAAPDAEDIDRMLVDLARDMPASKAAAEASRLTGRPKSDLYRRLLELKTSDDGA